MKPNTILQKILSRYRLHHPVSESGRQRMFSARKKTLAVIMKNKGKYGIFFAVVLKIFYLSRRFGIPLSVAKSAMVATTALLVATGGVATTTYYTVKYIQHELKTTVSEEIPAFSPVDGIEHPVISTLPAPVEYDIAIGKFQSSVSDGNLADALEDDLKTRLSRIRGKEKVIMLSKLPPDAKKLPRYLLLGSIIPMGENVRVSARLVEMSTSKIVVYVSQTIDGEENIHEVGKAIAGKIAGIQ
jgi:TolB-like protein